MATVNVSNTPSYFNTTNNGTDTRNTHWNGVHLAGMSVITIVGVTGNVMVALVMLRPRLHRLSSSVYLLLLAVADSACLLLNPSLQDWMQKDTGSSLYSVPWLCRIYLWLRLSVPFVSSWLIVLVTMERVVVVSRPLYAKVWCTRKTAWRISMGLFLFMFLGNIYVFPLGKSDCCKLDAATLNIMTTVAMATFSGIPFVFILVSNAVIVTQLSRQRRRMLNELKVNHQKQREALQLTTMLVTNSCAFILLTFPYNTVLLYKQLGGKPAPWCMIMAKYLIFVNHACNFFLYTMSGSLYRHELKSLCSIRARRRARRAYSNVSRGRNDTTGSGSGRRSNCYSTEMTIL